MNILFISTHLPREGVSAGAGRVFSLLKSISREHSITLISLASAEEKNCDLAALHKYCRKVHLLDRNGRCGIARFLSLRPSWITSEYGSHAMRSLIRKELKEGNYDFVQCEFLEASCNLPSFSGIPSILTHHEVKSPLLLESCKKADGFFDKVKLFLKWMLMRRFELRSCRRFSAVVTINEEEGILLERYLPGLRNVTIPMWVDRNYFSPADAAPEENSLVFTGYFGHYPNVDAAVYLVKEILPLIRKKVPGVRVYIVGSYPSREILTLGQEEGVTVTGMVPDIRPYLARACIFVAPIRTGGGMRGKILEAMAMGKAVVTTPRGASGLKARNEKEIVIAEGREEFANRTVELLLDKGKREKIGNAAIKMVRADYEQELQADKYLQLYQSLMSLRPRVRQSSLADGGKQSRTSLRDVGTRYDHVRKNILYLDEQMTRQAGGSYCLFNFITRLDREKFSPIIASSKGELLAKFHAEGGKVFVTTFPKIHRVSFKAGKLKFFNPAALAAGIIQLLPLTFKLLGIIRKEKIDLLHTNSFRAHLAGFIAGKISRRPVIWHLREVPREESIFIRAIGRRYVNGLLFMSEAIQKAYLQGEEPGRKMRVIYDGIIMNGNISGGAKIAVREELGIPQGIPVVGIVGRLVPVKGHRYFVQAAQKIIECVKDARFLVVGGNLSRSSEKDFSGKIRDMVEKAGLSGYFIWTGFHTEPLKILSSIDILVCPSVEEGFGMAVLEAVACGTPVIASNVGGIPEILRHGGGILVPPENPGAIAEEAVRLLNDPDEYRKISLAGIKNARDNFPIGLTVRKIEEFYGEVLNG